MKNREDDTNLIDKKNTSGISVNSNSSSNNSNSTNNSKNTNDLPNQNSLIHLDDIPLVDEPKDVIPIHKQLRSALNLAGLLSESDKAKKPHDNRSTRFSSTVHICLIPPRNELKAIVNELFWKTEVICY